jgi:hypothetical protein
VYVVPSHACRVGVRAPVDVAEVGGGTVEAVTGGDGVVLRRGRVGAVEVAAAWWRSRRW